MEARNRSVVAGAVAVVAAAAIGIGVAAGQSDPDGAGAVRPAVIDPACVQGVAATDPGPGASPREGGLMARSDALNRRYGLGRYAEGGDCADVPDWFTALVLRSDAMNREAGLGTYSADRR